MLDAGFDVLAMVLSWEVDESRGLRLQQTGPSLGNCNGADKTEYVDASVFLLPVNRQPCRLA